MSVTWQMEVKEIDEYVELIRLLNSTAHDLFAQTDFNAGINKMLERLRVYFCAERAYVFENNYKDQMACNTYEVCGSCITSEKENLQNIPFESFGFWLKAFSNKDYINIPDVKLIDESRTEEKALLEMQNIQSLIAVPLYRDEILIGFLGVDNPKEKNTHVDGLTALGDYMAIALTERDNYLNLKNENDLFSSILNHIPGGVGVYHYYKDGRLEQNFLNDGYYGMLGVSRLERSQYNSFSVVNAIYPEDLKQVRVMFEETVGHKTFGEIDLRILDKENNYSWINAKVKVVEQDEEKTTLYVFFSDINMLKIAQLQLNAQQKATSLASASGGIMFWMYNIDKRQVSTLFGDKIIWENAEPADGEIKDYSIWLDPSNVYKPDIGTFLRMHHELEEDAENGKCTVRIMNSNLKRYEWRHIYYTRLHDPLYTNRTAIGFSVSADLEQENRQHYERELLLRREMIKNAVIYYQLNLTQGTVEECQMIPKDFLGIKAGDKTDDIYYRKVMGGVLEEDRQRVHTVLSVHALKDAFFKGETSNAITYRAIFPGKGMRWIQTSVTTTEHYSTGDILAFLFSYDIDSQKKDQLAIEAIMDEEIESVVVINVESGKAHFAQFNAEYENINADETFDYDKIYCEIIHSYVFEEDRPECEGFFYIAKMVEALKEENVIKLMYRFVNRQGTMLRKKTRAFYLDSTHREIILIRRDITDLYEEEQRQKRELESAVDAANRANMAKSDFLSRMSHDMRTPLNAVLSFSGKEITQTATEAQLREYLSKIHSSGGYLLGIINDVLDMAKIEQNKMVLNRAPYSIDEFIGLVRTVIGESCLNKGIHLYLDCKLLAGKWVNVDKVRFNQVFMNLLSNAVKFTRPSGQIDFIMSNCTEEKGADFCRFIVRDNGIGMSKDFLPKAFESFSQETNDKIAQNNPGTGLGLSIVKKIVDIMGGTVLLESELDKGTCFTIDIPLTVVPAPEEETVETEKPINFDGIHILLCEDNDINAEIAQVLLSEKNCVVEWARNGKIGLEMFQESELNHYTVILMDIRMPVMDGYEATKAIRSLQRTDAASVPIIAMTADAFAQDEQSSIEVGMDSHLSKPIDADVFFNTLQVLIHRKKNREQRETK